MPCALLSGLIDPADKCYMLIRKSVANCSMLDILLVYVHHVTSHEQSNSAALTFTNHALIYVGVRYFLIAWTSPE